MNPVAFKQVGELLLACILVTNCCLDLRGQTKTYPSEQDSTLVRKEKARLQRFEHELTTLQDLLKIPGMSVAIVKDQQLLWSKGLGFADYDTKTPVSKDTPYRIASLTKTFASTLVMQLVEEGKVNLDDPMSKYSRDFKDDGVKVRHVLTHTSEGTPGERYSYNGDRYASLGAVIEKASGKSFRTALAENILDKLDMTSSVPGQDVLGETSGIGNAFSLEKLKRYETVLLKLAKPYSLYGDQIVLSTYPPKRITAAAGLISTVTDLAKYDVALDHHILLKKKTQEEVWTPTVSTEGGILPYGLGWFVQNYRGLKLVWHYGYWPTFSALILKVPERNVTLILLANSDGLSAPFSYPFGLGAGDVTWSAFACAFMRLFVFEDLYKKALTSPDWKLSPGELSHQIQKLDEAYQYKGELRAYYAMQRYLASRRAWSRPETKLDPIVFDEYVGQFELYPDNIITISNERGKLMMQRTGEEKVELFPESATEFFTKTTGVQIAFIRGKPGQVTYMVFYQYGPRQARKIR
jgi:CubicO group peptidase (beta-lactamase class C family)